MLENNKNFKFYSDLDEISLENEDGYNESANSYIECAPSRKLNSFFSGLKQGGHKVRLNHALRPGDAAKKYYKISLNRYLNSVQYAFEKGNFTTKKVSEAFNNIPEPASKRLIQITLLFLSLAIIIFLVSCQANQRNSYGQRSTNSPYIKNRSQIFSAKSLQKKAGLTEKGKEQLYIKRESKKIIQKDTGSSSGSIWADSSAPKSLATEFKPSRAGDYLTVNIPDNLQFKDEAAASGNAAGQAPAPKVEPVKSMKFQIAGIESGGDVYLRGLKTYTSENGEQRNIMVLAKTPRRNINNSEINAKDLTEVAVNENVNGNSSDYSSPGWDPTVSRKVAGYSPDLSAQTAKFDAAQKEIETQKKALADQQKALTDGNDRLKKDRQRLDDETARARTLLDAATIVSSSEIPPAAESAGGTAKTANAPPPPSAAAPAAVGGGKP